MSSFGIAFAPHLSLWLLGTFGAIALLILAFSVYRGAHGAWARLIAVTIVLLALANPLIVTETREGLSNIVALVIDRSQSMDIGSRKDDSEKALGAFREKLKTMGVEVREADVRTNADSGDTGGTALFAALNAALSEAPPDRVAGAIVITDGQPTAYFSRGRLYCEWPLSFGGISMRAAQETLKEVERVTRKGFDTFCPVGPWIVTEDEIGDAIGNLRGRLWVNGELRQQANTRDLIVNIPQMIAIASSAATLYPGDIIASGTPAGVGPVVAGDVIHIEVGQVGAGKRMRKFSN